MWTLHFGWLFALGVGVGALGTLIGAGGGFLLVPILLLLYPREQPETIASISLAVVFFNAASGSLAYAWQKRIDYRSAILFTLTTVPGAIVGALVTSHVPRRLFDALLGAVMLTTAAYLLLERKREFQYEDAEAHVKPGDEQHPKLDTKKTLLGMALSGILGGLSSLLGIGGGIVHVPLLVKVLSFPVHIATATSHLILAITALAGTIVHIANGAFHHGVVRTTFLSMGVVVGAQIGARLSTLMGGKWIMRGLGLALLLVALRLLIAACMNR